VNVQFVDALMQPGDIPDVTESLPFARNAACAGAPLGLFFPDKDQAHAAIEQARTLCRDCPVQADCLAWAVTHNEQGVWAGTTEQQRRAIRSQKPGRPAKAA